MMPVHRFWVEVDGGGDVGVLRLKVGGDVDLASAEALQAAMDRALRQGPHRLEVDLTEVTYFSCAGLQVLLAAWDRAGPKVQVVGAGRPVRRLLEVLQMQPLAADRRR